jgi:hypothetical protein
MVLESTGLVKALPQVTASRPTPVVSGVAEHQPAEKAATASTPTTHNERPTRTFSQQTIAVHAELRGSEVLQK